MKRIISIVIWIMSVILAGLVFMMPMVVPMHWNSEWQIDGYGSRYMMLIFALLPLVVYYGMELTKRIDPKKKDFQNKEKTYDLFQCGLSLFFIALGFFLECMVLFPQLNGNILMMVLLGGMLVLMGNYMPRIPQNYFLGIKTPWTLANEYVWNKTHKIGGYSFVILGIIFIIGGLLDLSFMYVVVIMLVVDVIIVYGYSYYVYKKTGENIE